jgi:hypothetical protein
VDKTTRLSLQTQTSQWIIVVAYLLVIFDFILLSGAELLGMEKRSPMFLFSYDQKMSQSDMHQSIEMRWFTALFMKNFQ